MQLQRTKFLFDLTIRNRNYLYCKFILVAKFVCCSSCWLPRNKLYKFAFGFLLRQTSINIKFIFTWRTTLNLIFCAHNYSGSRWFTSSLARRRLMGIAVERNQHKLASKQIFARGGRRSSNLMTGWEAVILASRWTERRTWGTLAAGCFSHHQQCDVAHLLATACWLCQFPENQVEWRRRRRRDRRAAKSRQ